jgi:hypothetical protein
MGRAIFSRSLPILASATCVILLVSLVWPPIAAAYWEETVLLFTGYDEVFCAYMGFPYCNDVCQAYGGLTGGYCDANFYPYDGWICACYCHCQYW